MTGTYEDFIGRCSATSGSGLVRTGDSRCRSALIPLRLQSPFVTSWLTPRPGPSMRDHQPSRSGSTTALCGFIRSPTATEDTAARQPIISCRRYGNLRSRGALSVARMMLKGRGDGTWPLSKRPTGGCWIHSRPSPSVDIAVGCSRSRASLATDRLPRVSRAPFSTTRALPPLTLRTRHSPLPEPGSGRQPVAPRLSSSPWSDFGHDPTASGWRSGHQPFRHWAGHGGHRRVPHEVARVDHTVSVRTDANS